MKVGDLVTTRYWHPNGWDRPYGLVIEVGIYTGNKDTKVLWEDGEVQTSESISLNIISDNRVKTA